MKNLLKTLQAVLAAFIGIRGGSNHDADMKELNPLHVLIVGVVCGLMFVLVLVLIVQAVLRNVAI